MRKVFLDDLPHKKGNNNKIDWKNSIGAWVPFIYDSIENKVQIVNYNEKYLYIKYKDEDIFKILTDGFAKGKLGKLLGIVTMKFRANIGENIRNLTIIDREYRINKYGQNQKWYRYKCNLCTWDNGYMEESALLSKGQNCSCCSGSVCVEGINDVATTDLKIVKFFKNLEDAKKNTHGSEKTVQVICPECGEEKEIAVWILCYYGSIRCTCGDGFSYGHKYIYNLLTQLDQQFKGNLRFDWCKFYNPYKNKDMNGEYDFVLENNKIIIEVDGEFHRKDNMMNGQTKEESKYIDDEKDRLASENGYKIIRIYYDDKNTEIKTYILESELNNIFNLSSIDWDICEKFALCNLIKTASEYKKNNPDVTSIQISELMGLSIPTIISYLKKGSKIGWCNYNPKEESHKAGAKSGKACGKPVEIFKDLVSLGIFESTLDLERQSEKLLGIKLNHSSISLICNNKKDTYKGFTFKYIPNQQPTSQEEAPNQVASF